MIKKNLPLKLYADAVKSMGLHNTLDDNCPVCNCPDKYFVGGVLNYETGGKLMLYQCQSCDHMWPISGRSICDEVAIIKEQGL